MEPWILHEFEEDFYGEELRLVVRQNPVASVFT